MSDTVYYKHPGGTVGSCTRDHWNERLTEWEDGTQYPKHGYAEITEDEARELNPQLFGARDPDVDRQMTIEEQTRALDRERNEQRLHELSAQNMAARQAGN
ncbi:MULTISPECIES: hypothetical protein [Arthrobacter]|uniref:Centromere-binding protein ParB C-terminal domain-containing protein n=2 Tax=Arthrobacter TaxID=1663 RepID=A0ABU9KHV3_9MICC|nr:hypothetical protein [Arthrobacter sp. YJM1]MDP5226632.1 hypothetical protein [Arthrobacter sp. YJM1]